MFADPIISENLRVRSKELRNRAQKIRDEVRKSRFASMLGRLGKSQHAAVNASGFSVSFSRS